MTPTPAQYKEIGRVIQTLYEAKYREFVAPASAIARDLREFLNEFSIDECDHQLFVLNRLETARYNACMLHFKKL